MRVWGAVPLKIVSANLQSLANVDAGAASDYIGKSQPDLIALQELGHDAAALFERNRADYPYKKLFPSANKEGSGAGIMSKLPINSASLHSFGHNFPTIECEVQTPAGPVVVVNAHPWPPGSWVMWEEQLLWESGVASLVRASKNPVIVVGDFNASQWGWVFRKLVDDTKLQDTSLGYGIQPTWPTDVPALGIAIDHVLASREFQVLRHYPGPKIGSDHWPLVVELSLLKSDSTKALSNKPIRQF